MILYQLKKTRLAAFTAAVLGFAAWTLANDANAQVDQSFSRDTEAVRQARSGNVNGSNSASGFFNKAGTTGTFIDKMHHKDFYAQNLYNPESQFVNTSDPELMDAFKNNDYGFLLSYYQTKCKASDIGSQKGIDDYLDHSTGVGNCHYLAWLYYEGLGVPANVPQAIAYYQIAADGGYWPSVRKLAIFYFVGKDVPKDPDKGVDILMHFTTNPKTPEPYICLGAKTLGDLYRLGEYVPKSGSNAVKWYQYCRDNSRNNDNTPAWLTVRTTSVFANMYADSDGPIPNPVKAAFLYQYLLGFKGLDPADVVNAQVHMGQYYVTGTGVAKDVGKGLELLKTASDVGKSSDAALTLAKLYASGDGVPADPALAAKYLQQAADGRNAEAQYMMGENALNQATPDLKEGTSWLQSSAILGYAKAQYALGELALKSGTDADMVVYAFVWFDFASQNQDDRAAKQRDEVAAKLSPDQMAKAKATEVHLKEKFPTIVTAS